MGALNADKENCPHRDKFVSSFNGLMEKIMESCPVDEAADEMAKEY